MGEISIGRALGAGFSLLRRHPAAFVVWTGVYLILGVLPQFGIMALMMPSYAHLAQSAAAGGGVAPQVMQTQMQMLQIAPLSWLLSVLCQALLLGAAYRAVLFPQDKGFFYLRLSVREFWLALVCLVLLIGFVVVMFMIMLPVALVGGIVGAAAGGGGGSAAAVLFVFAAMIAVVAVLIWLALRMSLAPPMAFAERRFRLFESWEATRGQAGRMFGVAAVIVGLLFAAEIVVMGVAFFATGGLSALAGLMQTNGGPAAVMARMLPVSVVATLVLSPLAVAFYVLFGGAWAQMYRDIFPPSEEVFS